MPKTEKIHLLNGSVALYQPDGGFRPGLDSVMVAAACPAKTGDSVLDAGCGVGSAGLCLSQRIDNISLTGIDLANEYIELATKNGEENKANSSFECVDIQKYEPEDRFDHVICNPPFYKTGRHLKSPDALKAVAHGADDEFLPLDKWIKHIHRVLRSKGSLTMIHQAECLEDIIVSVHKQFGAIEIIPLWPKLGTPAKRVVVRAYKDRHTPLTMTSGLVLHEQDGDYTKEANRILKDGEGLLL